MKPLPGNGDALVRFIRTVPKRKLNVLLRKAKFHELKAAKPKNPRRKA